MRATKCGARAVCVVTLFCCGCVSSGGRSAALASPQQNSIDEPSRYGSPSDVLTATELLRVNPTSTADGVRRLRPEFVRATSAPGLSGIEAVWPSVYVNGKHIGGPDELERIPVDAVAEIRFVKPGQARDFWGAMCPCSAGVIHVRTRVSTP